MHTPAGRKIQELSRLSKLMIEAHDLSLRLQRSVEPILEPKRRDRYDAALERSRRHLARAVGELTDATMLACNLEPRDADGRER